MQMEKEQFEKCNKMCIKTVINARVKKSNQQLKLTAVIF